MGTKSNAIRLREWASLSALTSAALAGGSGTAFATMISHGPAKLPISLPGGNSIRVSRSSAGFSDTTIRTFRNVREISLVRTRPYDAHLIGVSFAGPAAKGQTFNQVGLATPFLAAERRVSTRRKTVTVVPSHSHPRLLNLEGEVASLFMFAQRFHSTAVGTQYNPVSVRASGSAINTTINPSPYSDQYALFRFKVGSQTDYGWLELNLSYPTTGDPIFTVLGYAYDTSGNPIPAGVPSVPEPRDLPLAMGALALGALGLRGWRKAHTAKLS